MSGIKRSIAVVLIAACAVFLTVRAFVAGSETELVRTVIRLGAEEAANRIRTLESQKAVVRKLSDASSIAKARALAHIVQSDPSQVTRPHAMENICRELDVDEAHVSDARGVLIASHPASYKGYDMSSGTQSAAFLPALTNREFVLVQEPMTTAIKSGCVMQYVGVARRDQPGIVQVGYDLSRLETMRQLTDVQAIAKSTHVGRSGRVSIGLRTQQRVEGKGYHVEDATNGVSRAVLVTDCGDYRITVSHPLTNSPLADPLVRDLLIVVDLILLTLLLVASPTMRRVAHEDWVAVKTLFAGVHQQHTTVTKMIKSPVALIGLGAFVMAIAVCWLVTNQTSRKSAEEMLRAAAADMRSNIDVCVDGLLFYQGNAICEHYKTPQNMSCETVQNVMSRYGLDELNVVDERGIVIAGALAEVGYDMGSRPLTAEFNRLLRGVKTYSQAFRGAVENPTLRRKYAGIAFPPPAKGYIQLGFAESRIKDGIDYWFADVANDWHIGESGFYVVAKDETGVIDSCGYVDANGRSVAQPGDTLARIGFDVISAPRDPNQFFTATLFGVDCLCLTDVRGFHRIISALPLSEVRQGGRHTVFITALVLAFLLIFVVFFMTRLSDLVSSLRGYIAREHETQEKELKLARTIQLSSLPVTFPDTPHFHVYARMDAAREVGGDFYDFYELPSGKWLFLVADVSGKGISAALFMMKARAIIKASIFGCADLAAAIVDANNRLSEHNDAEMFVTAWIATYDPATGDVEYVNAGHNPPLVKRADGSVAWLTTRGGLALAAIDGARYRTAHLTLNAGDSLFLYTDGVTEAMNCAGELFGEARLEQVLANAGERYVEEVRAALAAFVKDAEQSDDITMLAFDTHPNPIRKER